jgi:large subunit ribosomal protein L28
MARECYICNKKATVGGSVTHRGIAKKSGGIGLQLVKNTKRVFKPNLQKLKITVGGSKLSTLVCTSCIRSGKVTK